MSLSFNNYNVFQQKYHHTTKPPCTPGFAMYECLSYDYIASARISDHTPYCDHSGAAQ